MGHMEVETYYLPITVYLVMRGRYMEEDTLRVTC